MPHRHTDQDGLRYAAAMVGSSCMPYTHHSVTHHGEDVAVKFFLTNVGDVLRRVFLCQPDPFVDKAAVTVTVVCGGVKVVDGVSWAAWQAAQGTHDMCNELRFLDSTGRAVKWPMHAVVQDCMALILRMPRAMWERSGSPRDLTGWMVLAVWDQMDTQWRRTADTQILELHTPVKEHFCVEDGELRYARDGLRASHAKRLSAHSKRRSNPLC